jgi:protoporphyrin/coproporphyrin ferrochelatase
MSGPALIVMAYGTARDLDDVERYYTDIRRGRPPTPESLEDLRDRYRAIGGRSPLLEITRAQVDGLAERLSGVPVLLGQKHSPPFIDDAVEAMIANGATSALGLVLAPHFSSMSVGDYERRLRAAADRRGWEGRIDMIESWHLEPGYLEMLAGRVKEALDGLPDASPEQTQVVFSAHSLPQRILDAGDPYPTQLEETGAAVASLLGLPRWRTGWQSAGRTEESWLGPDILEIVEKEAAEGTRALVVCPCGFVADHLEVLYDLDIEAASAAARHGLYLTRTRSPNADAGFIDVLASVARRALPV